MRLILQPPITSPFQKTTQPTVISLTSNTKEEEIRDILQLRMLKPAHAVLLQHVDPLAYQSTYPSTPYLDVTEVPIGLRFSPETVRQVLQDSSLFDVSQIESWSEEVITPFGTDSVG